MTYALYPSLRDRVVFVSGGSSGIGAELVRAFAAQGSRVAFCGTREDGGAALIDEIVAAGHPRPWYAACDVRDAVAYQALLRRAIAELGPPSDVAVQFAPAPVPVRSIRGWRRWMPIVLPAVVLVVALMISVSSLLLLRDGLTYGLRVVLWRNLRYTAAIGALTAMLGVLLAPHGIRRGDGVALRALGLGTALLGGGEDRAVSADDVAAWPVEVAQLGPGVLGPVVVLRGVQHLQLVELGAQGFELGHVDFLDVAEMRDAAFGLLHLLRNLAAQADDGDGLFAMALGVGERPTRSK